MWTVKRTAPGQHPWRAAQAPTLAEAYALRATASATDSVTPLARLAARGSCTFEVPQNARPSGKLSNNATPFRLAQFARYASLEVWMFLSKPKGVAEQVAVGGVRQSRKRWRT